MASIIICGFTIINKPNTMNNIEDEIEKEDGDYIPYGKEWEIELRETNKDFLINFIKNNLLKIKQFEAALQKQQSNVSGEWISDLQKLRDEIYNCLPNGTLSAWDLLNLINFHISSIDEVIAKHETQPTEQSNESEDAVWKIVISEVNTWRNDTFDDRTHIQFVDNIKKSFSIKRK